jgi:hypothetical protein
VIKTIKKQLKRQNNVDSKLTIHTVLESSLPDSIMRKHKGIISVVNKKLITSCSSVFTKAPTENIDKQNYFRVRVSS